jgi:hypothetical protein
VIRVKIYTILALKEILGPRIQEWSTTAAEFLALKKTPSITIPIDYSDSQIPFSTPSFYPDPEYPMDSWDDWEVDL